MTDAAAAELVWTEVDSSNVQAVAYHDESKTLCVMFRNGGLYSYSDVDHGTYVDLVHAQSVGQYLSRVVKGLHPYTKYLSMLDLKDNLF